MKFESHIISGAVVSPCPSFSKDTGGIERQMCFPRSAALQLCTDYTLSFLTLDAHVSSFLLPSTHHSRFSAFYRFAGLHTATRCSHSILKGLVTILWRLVICAIVKGKRCRSFSEICIAVQTWANFSQTASQFSACSLCGRPSTLPVENWRLVWLRLVNAGSAIGASLVQMTLLTGYIHKLIARRSGLYDTSPISAFLIAILSSSTKCTVQTRRQTIPESAVAMDLDATRMEVYFHDYRLACSMIVVFLKAFLFRRTPTEGVESCISVGL